MSAKDLYEHIDRSWDEESQYAETLRSRRNVLGSAFVVATGFGAFQLTPLMSADATHAVTIAWIRWTVTAMLIAAMVTFLIAGYLLFVRGEESATERKIRKQAHDIYGRSFSIRRASEYWTLSPEEEAAIMASAPPGEGSIGRADSEIGWTIRAKKMEFGLRYLSAANRRVSNRIKAGWFWVATGFILLVLAIAFQSVGINLRTVAAGQRHDNDRSTNLRHDQGPAGRGPDGGAVRGEGDPPPGPGHP